MRLVTIREPFVTAEVLRVLDINLRKQMDYTYLHSLFYLFAEQLELNYEFTIKSDVVHSRALEEDFKLFRVIGTRVLPHSLLDDGTIEAIKRAVECFNPPEIITLAKVKAEMDGIAPAYLTRKRALIELWDLFCNVTKGHTLVVPPKP